VAVGIILACMAFAFNIGQLRLLKLGLSRTVYRGSVDRSSEHQEQLVIHGNRIQIIWLHGFVFFGSANRLLMQIQDIIEAQGGSCQSLILDFRQVLGIDSSAVITLVKLFQLAERKNFTVLFAGLPAQVERVLRAGGLIGDSDSSSYRVFGDSDSALEWCEDRLLGEILTGEAARKSADEWLTREIGGDRFARLIPYLTRVEIGPGDLLIRQGEAGDSLYMLSDGRVTVVLRTPDGVELRLRSMVGQTIIGEMGLYRTLPRGASVRADGTTFAYRLSLDAMRQMEQDEPDLAHAFHRLVVRTLAERLDYANREIAGLRR
jgi:SulP family sulfate permease